MLVTIYWRTRVKVKQLTLSFPQMNTAVVFVKKMFYKEHHILIVIVVDCLLYTFIKGTFAIYDLESIILLSFATGFFFIITILLILTLTGKSISWQRGAFGWLVQGT